MLTITILIARRLFFYLDKEGEGGLHTHLVGDAYEKVLIHINQM